MDSRTKLIYSWKDLHDFAEQDFRTGHLMCPIEAGDNPVVVPEGKRITRWGVDCTIDFQKKPARLFMDGKLALGDTELEPIFLNTVPNWGPLPSDQQVVQKEGPGGQQFGGSTLASVTGKFGGQDRYLVWWDDGDEAHERWVQAAIDSGYRSGVRQDAFNLYAKGGRQVYNIARPLNFDLRYTHLIGVGRDSTHFSWDFERWKRFEDDYILEVPSMFIMNAYRGIPAMNKPTGGFESQIREFSVRMHGSTGGYDTAAVAGYNRPEEMCRVERVSVFDAGKYTLLFSGFNGVVVDSVMSSGSSDDMVFFRHTGDSVGQAQIAISNCWANFGNRGMFADITGPCRLVTIRDCDGENCDQVLRQGHNASHVVIDGFQCWFNKETDLPLIETGVGGTDEDGQITTLKTSSTVVRDLHGVNRTKNIFMDHQAVRPDDPEFLRGGQLSTYSSTLLNIAEYRRCVSTDPGRRTYTDRMSTKSAPDSRVKATTRHHYKVELK